MADHPIENEIEITIKAEQPGSSGQAPPPTEPERTASGRVLPPRDEFGRFVKKLTDVAAKTIQKLDEARAANPPSAQAVNVPPEKPKIPHPDDPPPDWWPHVTEPKDRRRFMREHRRRVNRSLNMQEADRRRMAAAIARAQRKQRASATRLQKQQTAAAAKLKRQQQIAAAKKQRATARVTKRATRRRRVRLAKRLRAQRNRLGGFGRQAGAVLGANLGSRLGGSLGASLGASLGVSAGDALTSSPVVRQLGLKLMTAIKAIPLPVAIGAGAAIAGVAAAYKIYDSWHKSLNKRIADGFVPWAKALADSIPIIANFSGTIDAINKRFDRDRMIYSQFSPLLQQAEAIGGVQITLNRLRNAQQKNWEGRNLDELMSDFSRVRTRFNVANERIEATLSRIYYSVITPYLERGVTILEIISHLIEKNEKTGEIILRAFPATLEGALRSSFMSAMAAAFPGGGIPANIIEQLIRRWWRNLEEQHQEHLKKNAEFATTFANKIQSDLHGLMFGFADANLTPKERDDLAEWFKEFQNVGKPPGLGN